jgi:hypothetical protein
MEMNRLKTIWILFLSLCVGSFFMAGTAFSQENWYATADITKNQPVIKSLPEEKIPVETVKGKEGGSSKILWGILGVALVGGIVAVAGGGGGGGGGGGDDDTPTGDVNVSW